MKITSNLMTLAFLIILYSLSPRLLAEDFDSYENKDFKIIDGLSAKQLEKYEEQESKLQQIHFNEESCLFPKINFQNINGTNINLCEFRGIIVVLHFWASWCGHCVNEMLDLNKFVNILQEQEIDNQIVILPISIDDNFEYAKNFYKKYNIQNLDLYFDQGSKVFSSLNLRSLPKTFIIGKNGKQIARFDGAISWRGKHGMFKVLFNACNK